MKAIITNLTLQDGETEAVATQPISEQCLACQHNNPDILTCSAYPDGIPHDILSGGFDHTKPHEGDNGVRYEAQEGL